MGDSKGAAHARQSQVCALACDVSVVWMCCAVVSTLKSFKYFHKIFASHSVSDRFSANAYIKHNRSVWCAVGASTSRCWRRLTLSRSACGRRASSLSMIKFAFDNHFQYEFSIILLFWSLLWMVCIFSIYLVCLQTAVHCNTLQHTATHCITLQYNATHINILHNFLSIHTFLISTVGGKYVFCIFGIYTNCNTITHCNALQHTATHCNTLQHTATLSNILHYFKNTYLFSTMDGMYVFSVLQFVAVWCSVLRRVEMCCSLLQFVAVCCSVLQCTVEFYCGLYMCSQCVASWYSVLQYVAECWTTTPPPEPPCAVHALLSFAVLVWTAECALAQESSRKSKYGWRRSTGCVMGWDTTTQYKDAMYIHMRTHAHARTHTHTHTQIHTNTQIDTHT